MFLFEAKNTSLYFLPVGFGKNAVLPGLADASTARPHILWGVTDRGKTWKNISPR